jgi:hypothetical protein
VDGCAEASRAVGREGGERKLTPSGPTIPADASRCLCHHQLHVDVAPCCIGVRTDDVGFLYQGFHLLARQARHADLQLDFDAESGSFTSSTLSEETARPSRPPVALAWARYIIFSIDMTDS